MNKILKIFGIFILFIFSLNFINSAWIDDNTPLAFYPLTSNADDEGPSSYDGTNNGCTFDSKGAIGGYIELPVNTNDLNIEDEGSIVLVTNVSSANIFISDFDAVGSYHGMNFYNTGMYIYPNNRRITFSAVTDLHFLVMTWKNGGQLRYYKDGSLISSLSLSNDIGDSVNNFKIGTRGDSTAPLTGYVKNVIIYDKQLNSTEITNLYNAEGDPNETILTTNLSSYYTTENISIQINSTNTGNMSYILDGGNLTSICTNDDSCILNLNSLSQIDHSIHWYFDGDNLLNETFIIDYTPPTINFLNNFTNNTEINNYDFNISNYFNITDDNIKFTKELNYTGFNFLVTSEDNQPSGITFANDNFYMVGGQYKKIYEYNSTGSYTSFNFDVSGQMSLMGEITFANDNFYVLSLTDDTVYEYNSTGSYTSFNFYVGGEDSTPIGISFANDNFYMLGGQNDKVFEYNSTGSYTSFNFFVGGEDNAQYKLLLIDDFFYVLGAQYKKIYEYNLSGNYTGDNFYVGGEDSAPNGFVFFNEKIYIVGDSNDKIYGYEFYNINPSYNYENEFIKNIYEFEFENNGNETINIYAEDILGNSVNETYTIYVKPQLDYFFTMINGTDITDFIFHNITFNLSASLILYKDVFLSDVNLSFEKVGFLSTLIPVNYTEERFTQTYNYNISPASITLQFLDTTTDTPIIQNISFLMISEGGFSYESSTSNGSITINTLMFEEGDYTLLSNTQNYTTTTKKFYYSNQEELTLKVYLTPTDLENTADIIIQVVDGLSTGIEDADVEIYTWFSSSQSYELINEKTTNQIGQTYSSFELNTRLYTICAETDDLVKECKRDQFFSLLDTKITIKLDESKEVEEDEVSLNQIESSLSHVFPDNETIQMIYDVNDLSLTISKFCLKTYKYIDNDYDLVDEHCSYSQSGIISRDLDYNTSMAFLTKGYVYINETETLTDTEYVGDKGKYYDFFEENKLFSVLFFFLFLLVFAFLLSLRMHTVMLIGISIFFLVISFLLAFFGRDFFTLEIALIITLINGLTINFIHRRGK